MYFFIPVSLSLGNQYKNTLSVLFEYGDINNYNTVYCGRLLNVNVNIIKYYKNLKTILNFKTMP
jgi:hypothetical protein